MSRRAPRSRSVHRISRFLTVLIAAAALVIGTVAPVTVATASASVGTSTSLARAAGDLSQTGIAKTTLAGFNPGNIISDAVFTNKNTMTEAQIQSFFNSKVSKCVVGKDENGKPFVCLKDFKITSVNRQADAYCTGYQGAANETAARIIYKVSQACSINPQVLIVMLQKEQGLVTHVWPSAWRYNIALGQGCPDTAPCDPGYIGFFHQIYGAARQMQMYMEGKYFNWYAPGKTWGIQWHPNASCGRGNVYVANKATSALYYYTPYQPNAAAMRAGYGEGDSCSSYGNRNFYNYFTDWFGSTQNPTNIQGLVKVGTAVWFLSGTNRYHVTAEAYPEYKAIYGAPTVVTSASLHPYKEGARGSFYVKNASTGVVAMLQAGQTHRFPSCGLVAEWGGACGAALVVMTNSHFSKFRTGSEMTSFGRLTNGGRIHQMTGTSLVPLFDASVAKDRNGGVAPYAAVFPAPVIGNRTVETRLRFETATFVKVNTAPEVWLADEAGKLHHLPSWPLAAELGLPSKVGTTVSTGDLAGYTKSEPLSPFVQCGGKNYAAAGGKLSVLSGPVPSGFTAVVLDSAACGRLNLNGTKVNGNAVFVQFSGSSDVFHLTGGEYRAVPAAAQRTVINEGTTPTVLTAGSAYRKVAKIGTAYPASATFIRVSGTSEVWLVDGAKLVHLPSWAMAAEYGLPSGSGVVGADAIVGMTKQGVLAPFATCGGNTYVATGGKLRAVSSAQVGGNAVSALSTQVCTGRTIGTASEAPVFLGDGNRTVVAVGSGFLSLPDQSSVSRAAAGAQAVINSVSSAYLDRLPTADVPGEGGLVRASNESAVTLINGNIRQRIPNWGVAADLGVQARYQVAVPQALAVRGIGGNDLGVFVQCGSTSYIGSKGVLHPVKVTALGGFTPTALSAQVCKTLTLSTAAQISTIRVTSTAGVVYGVDGGKLVPTSGGDESVTPLMLDDRTIAGMPKD